ncbi:hypothetical protein AB9K26_14545 [Psychroserpens sp. XS_ASV72]|uniref:hypothetical protein n=1 Tax=Psychroserpens sp. XS_ASV72 TaxID=3241293 RepID=UPI003519D270
MVNKYFNYAIIIDIIVSFTLCVICHFLLRYKIIIIPETDILISTVSDIANIGFTSAGFVLTFLTLLVSFKSTTEPIKNKSTLEETYSGISLFNLFLNSPLYKETIKHLKNGVKVLILIAIVGYISKICVSPAHTRVLFYYNIIGVSMIALVLWRSLLVLSGVLKVQNFE